MMPLLLQLMLNHPMSSDMMKRMLGLSDLAISIPPYGVLGDSIPDFSALPLLDVIQLPALVEERLERAVETEDRKPASARHGLDPVLLLTCRCVGSEVDVDAAVAV